DLLDLLRCGRLPAGPCRERRSGLPVVVPVLPYDCGEHDESIRQQDTGPERNRTRVASPAAVIGFGLYGAPRGSSRCAEQDRNQLNRNLTDLANAIRALRQEEEGK